MSKNCDHRFEYFDDYIGYENEEVYDYYKCKRCNQIRRVKKSNRLPKFYTDSIDKEHDEWWGHGECIENKSEDVSDKDSNVIHLDDYRK